MLKEKGKVKKVQLEKGYLKRWIFWSLFKRRTTGRKAAAEWLKLSLFGVRKLNDSKNVVCAFGYSVVPRDTV